MMTNGVAEKGYRMTQNRKNILNTLIGQGGAVKSSEGRATALLHGLVDHGGSLVSLNATLRELESLGFIEREVEGRRTYAISITDKARTELGDELAAAPVASISEARQRMEARTAAASVESNGATATVPETEVPSSNGATTTPVPEVTATAPVPEVIGIAEVPAWDWDEEQATVPDGIDYNILLGVFLKAAIRGMEGPSNTELDFYKKANEQATIRIQNLEDEVESLRGEAAKATSERDQLQKNLNILMSRSEQKRTGRGSNPIKNLLSADELHALDTLMRQAPMTKGE